MMEVLNFIFSSFWIWLGTVVLISAASQGVVAVLCVLLGRK